MHLSVTVGVEQREVGGMDAAAVNAVTDLRAVPTGVLRDVLVADRAGPFLGSPAHDEGCPACPSKPCGPEATGIRCFPGRVIGGRIPLHRAMTCDRHLSPSLEVDRSHAWMPSLALTVEAPRLLPNRMVVALLDPSNPLLRVSSVGPPPQTVADGAVQALQGGLAHHVPVIGRPSPQDRVARGDQLTGWQLLVCCDAPSDVRQHGVDACAGGFDDPLPAVLAEVLSEDIHAVVDRRERRLLRGAREPSRLKQRRDQRVDCLCSPRLGSAGAAAIVRSATERDLGLPTFSTGQRDVCPSPACQAIECQGGHDG
jgi:hypothetical protein